MKKTPPNLSILVQHMLYLKIQAHEKLDFN